jgi:hypothetical protein
MGSSIQYCFPSGTAAADQCCVRLGLCTTLGVKMNNFRREAEECRRNAEQTMNRRDRDSWLRLADDLMKLAQSEGLRIKIAALNRLRDFTAAAATADSLYSDKWDDPDFAASKLFPEG